MWPQIGEIHDLDHGKPGGTFFKGEQRPTEETAFPLKHEEKKATDIGALRHSRHEADFHP